MFVDEPQLFVEDFESVHEEFEVFGQDFQTFTSVECTFASTPDKVCLTFEVLLADFAPVWFQIFDEEMNHASVLKIFAKRCFFES